jgi:hypothetical protein
LSLRLRGFDNRVLRRIFEFKSIEVTGGWRKLYNEELCNLYSSSDIRVIKLGRIKWVGQVVCTGKTRNAYKMLVRKPEGKRPLGRPWHRLHLILKWSLGK